MKGFPLFDTKPIMLNNILLKTRAISQRNFVYYNLPTLTFGTDRVCFIRIGRLSHQDITLQRTYEEGRKSNPAGFEPRDLDRDRVMCFSGF